MQDSHLKKFQKARCMNQKIIQNNTEGDFN